MLNPNTAGLNPKSTLRSSTSTHALNNNEVRLNYITLKNSITRTILVLEIVVLELQ